ncbi:MAG: GNAT family N-acetyltransferase [Candidatus Limiplasma sp.]|nr:GNAT family N-acetyltransferase [Candidatus Limiplasma sp.]MEA5144841.1 GNAT family N-acetyltransferase [Candidatus Limiplasma sp.]
MQLHTKPLSPQTEEDFFTFFDRVAFREHPEWGCDCYCCFFHATDRALWEQTTGAENAAQARRMIRCGQMRGLLAYDGALPIGWCHFDTLANLPGARTFYGALATGAPEDGAIVCFTIAQGFRGQGVAKRLLEDALAQLAAMGVRRVEAYPLLAGNDPEHHYHGPLALYTGQGFAQVREHEGMALVEKLL